MNAWILLHTPDLPWEKHNLIIFNIRFHYAFALLITGTVAIRNIGKNKYWDVIPTFSVMSSEQDASSIPDGSHLMAFTSFCKQTNMFICCWRTVNPDTREWVSVCCSPCALGRTWADAHFPGGTHGCTCQCCRRRRCCCSASPRPAPELQEFRNTTSASAALHLIKLVSDTLELKDLHYNPPK